VKFVSAQPGICGFCLNTGEIYTVLQIEEDVSMPGVKFVVTKALCPGVELSHFNKKFIL
jgi:hypothetical protein